MKREINIDILNEKYETLMKKFILLQKEKKRDELRLRESKREIQRLEIKISELSKRN